MKKVDFLGVKVNNLTMKEVLVDLEKRLNEPNFKGYITTPNPEIILSAQKNKRLMNILNNSYLATPDGIGLILISFLFKEHLKERISGVDLMIEICRLAEKLKKTVCLKGKWDEAVIKAIKELKNLFPNLIFMKENEADIIFVGLGTPQQEEWIEDNLNKISAKLFLTVGGAFEIIAGIKPRAPKILRDFYFEWFWRFLLEPKKRFKRIFNAVIVFPFKVLLKTKLSRLI